MAGFKTHITVSSTLGVAYGAGAFFGYGVPAPTCCLAATLCGLAGMLPDLDSDSGVPLRESINFAAAVTPMLLIERFRQMGWGVETMALAGALIYVAVRFGLAAILKRYTVHRGMFHSIPAAIIAGEVFYLLASAHEPQLRLYKAGGVVLGFMSHLILDEIWAVGFKYGVPRFKSSFGTALKVWGDNLWANLSTYAKLAILTYAVFNDDRWMQQLHDRMAKPAGEVEQFASDVWQRFVR